MGVRRHCRAALSAGQGLAGPAITIEAPPALVEHEGELAQFVRVKIDNIEVGPYDCSAGIISKAGQAQFEGKIRGEGETPDMTIHIEARRPGGRAIERDHQRGRFQGSFDQ